MIAAIAIARRFWPIAAIAAVLLALMLWGNHREGQGVRKERAAWVAKEVLALEAARAREVALQSQVDAAGIALSMSTAEIERLANTARVTTRNYYVQNPAANVACLLPDRLRAIAESDAASTAAIAAK